MGSFSQTFIYTNTDNKGIRTHISGSTVLVKDCVFVLPVDLDMLVRMVLLCMVWIGRSGGDVVLAHDM